MKKVRRGCRNWGVRDSGKGIIIICIKGWSFISLSFIYPTFDKCYMRLIGHQSLQINTINLNT